MADINYMVLGDRELFNVARTALLARTIGLDVVRVRADLVEAQHDRFRQSAKLGFGEGPFGLGGFGEATSDNPADNYEDPTTSPWYDASQPASIEFAGVLPLEVTGINDSSLEAATTEYVGNGGNSGIARNGTQALVVSAIIVATTERGAEYGKRWLDRCLRSPDPTSNALTFYEGHDLTYLRYSATEGTPPLAHRRNVRLTRGTSVTRRRSRSCSTTWLLTFTLTAGGPFEYGEPVKTLAGLHPTSPYAAGSFVQSAGSLTMTEQQCPSFTYDPIFDPLFPALVASPTAPNFLPAGWDIEEGDSFKRTWVRLDDLPDQTLNCVPILKVSSTTEARMVRISIWSEDYPPDSQCDPVWSAVISYLPASSDFYINGEQNASYVWDGVSPYVRRTDSLVYSPRGNPVEWSSFVPGDNLLVALDTFAVSGGYQGADHVTVDVSLVAKSD